MRCTDRLAWLFPCPFPPRVHTTQVYDCGTRIETHRCLWHAGPHWRADFRERASARGKDPYAH